MSIQNISDETKIMKKRCLLLLVPCAVLLVMVGIWIGTKIDIEQLNKQNNYDSNINSTIAVVNQDTGVKNESGNVNYSEAFIASLNSDYKVVSYKEAQDGINSGDYSAMVIFPSDLSSSVYSINESTLQSPKIEFSVNPSLTESDYIGTYLKVLDLQNDINETISYLYVSSVYEELHNAQDEVKEIFKNDEDDMTALEEVKLHDFRLDVDWSDIPQVNFEPKEIDFEEFVSTVQGYADDMSEKYVDSYEVAQADYEQFQSGFSSMAQTVSEDGLSWYESVNDREGRVTNYATSVMSYRDDVADWSNDVSVWNESTNLWSGDIAGYLGRLESWQANVITWKSDMDIWGDLFKADMDLYQNSINSYKDAVSTCSNDMYNHYLTSTADWSKQYTDYADNVGEYLGDLRIYIEDYNQKVLVDNAYIADVNTYNNELSSYQGSIDAYASSVYSNYFEPLKGYHEELNSIFFGDENDENNNGLVGDINSYYSQLLDYENALNTYKTSLDNYSISYSHMVNFYWQQYYMGNTQIQQPVFNPDSASNASGVNNFDFEAIRSNIDSEQTIVNSYKQDKMDPVDSTKVQLETDYQNLVSTGSSIVSPAKPDYSQISEDGIIGTVDTSVFDSYVNPDFTQWDDAYEGIPEESDYVVYDTSISDAGIVENVAAFEEQAPIFSGGDIPLLETEEPKYLEDSLPQEPETFISSCEAIVGESAKYIPTNYLTEDTKSRVDSVVDMYASNLITVDSRLKSNMSSNNNLLTQAYNSYNSYVTTLRSDADTAYVNKENDLDDTLDIFYQAKEATSAENKELLEDFSEKLPNSRVNSVVNKELVNFMISPVDFASGEVRANSQFDISQQEKRLDLYGWIIIIVAPLLPIALLIILVLYRRDSRRARKVKYSV